MLAPAYSSLLFDVIGSYSLVGNSGAEYMKPVSVGVVENCRQFQSTGG